MNKSMKKVIRMILVISGAAVLGYLLGCLFSSPIVAIGTAAGIPPAIYELCFMERAV